MNVPLSITFNVHLGDRTEAITSESLGGYAEAIHLNSYAEGRYSWLFVLNMLSYQCLYGINPFQIVDEIRALEGPAKATRTKPASQFSRIPLKGLWHKHFFCSRFLAHNITTHLSGGKLDKLVSEVLDPNKSPVVTESMIRELSHRVAVEPFEQRAAERKLTGEWVVFAKHEGKNYYLCLATHGTEDQSIYDSIKAACWPQFPFLATTSAEAAV
jgi:hypothetical protein